VWLLWKLNFPPTSGKAVTLQIVLVPGLLCDASIWAAQIATLKPRADVAVADLSQLDSLEDMARAALGLREGPVVVIGIRWAGV
jgi:hypothetical protein